MHFLCFYPVLELTLHSLTTIQVEPHQCPSHQFILLIQGPTPKIFTKKYLELEELKNDHVDFFLIFFLLHPNENQFKFLGQQEWVEILMITLVSSPKQHLRKDMQHSVLHRLTRQDLGYCNYWKQFDQSRRVKKYFLIMDIANTFGDNQ